MKYIAIFLTISFLAGCSGEKPPSQSLSPEMTAARDKSLALCSGCHGPSGISTSDLAPNLAGQKKVYMIKQLIDFRSGTRSNHPPMEHIARMLTEKEIELISEWYSNL